MIILRWPKWPSEEHFGTDKQECPEAPADPMPDVPLLIIERLRLTEAAVREADGCDWHGSNDRQLKSDATTP